MEAELDKRLQHRIGVLGALLAACLALVALRLADLQIFRRGFLIAKAQRQQIRAVPVLGRRGRIMDRQGETLAQSLATESVFFSARMAKKDDLNELCAALSPLGASCAEIRRAIRLEKPYFIKRRVRLETTARLKELRFQSLTFEPETRREYPLGRLASHVVGFVNVDGAGLEGAERQFQKVLAGRSGKKEQLVDARGRMLPSASAWIKKPDDGDDVVLTLDAQFQHIAERELGKAFRKYSPKGASMVVMDPHNGEILALANLPDYDPNLPASFSDSARRNRAVTDAFEPGSTFKTLTAALALEEGLVTPDSPVDCNGGRQEYFGRTVRDHGDEHLGVVPFRTVFAQSSNVGTVEVALKLGPKKLHEGISRFGFGKPTGVDLPGEQAGIFRPLGEWTKASMASLPYGQELSCNLLHMARLYAAVANGGRLVTPHVVKEFRSPSGRRFDAGVKESGQVVLGGKVQGQLLAMLEEVVSGGTGSPTALPGFRVAGKTGTAQKYSQAAKAYTRHDNVSSFAGFVPAEDPKFVCVVMLDEPRGESLGGWVAGPVFRASMSAMLAARGLAPDEALMAKAEGIAPTKSTKWTAQLKKGQRAAVQKWVEVPDLEGKSLAQARDLLAKAGLRLKAQGAGSQVAAQFPGEGTDVREFSTVKIMLAPEPRRDRKGGRKS